MRLLLSWPRSIPRGSQRISPGPLPNATRGTLFEAEVAMQEAATVMTAAAGLASVLASGVIAVLSLRQSRHEHSTRLSHEFLLAALPRRLDAFEKTWRVLYDLESGQRLPPDRIAELVECSIWLPSDIVGSVIPLIAEPAEFDPE